MMTGKWIKLLILLNLFEFVLLTAVFSADIFQFNAPPGGVYLNSSFEQFSTQMVSVTIEHEGAAISEWFIAASTGDSTVYEPRELKFDTNIMEYQIYKTEEPSSNVIKAPTEALTLANVITASDFNTVAGSIEQNSYSMYFHIAAGQFLPAGTYTDTITLYLYTGNYADSGTHNLVDSTSITVFGRMAQLLDIYCIREPGIRFMDLTITQNDKLIATVNERSNSSTGYTVSITSKNLANDVSGAAQPYFLHSDSAGSLTYSLTYDGAAVVPWSAGTALLTSSDVITSSIWVSKELDISYSGSLSLPAGDYEDILTLTISAK